MPNTSELLNSVLSSRNWVRPFLLLVLAFSLYLAFTILRPFLNPIIMAIVLAALFHPVHSRLESLLKNRPNIAALCSVIIIFFVIIIPLFLVVGAFVDQGKQVTVMVRQWIHDGHLEELRSSEYLAMARQWLEDKIPFINFDELDIRDRLLSLTSTASQLFVTHGAAIAGNLAGLATNFFIMLFVLFYIIRDGKHMVQTLKHLSPLREKQEDHILEKVRSVSRSVLLGSLLTAICQGVVGGVGMVLVGLPGLFWGTMIAFSSLIPVVGTALIWVPTALYLLIIGSWKSAIFFTLWSALLMGSIDNFLRPFLMRGQAKMSPFYIFLAILGGAQVFGIAGLLYGPLIFGFAMVMLFIYEEEFRTQLAEDREPPQPKI